MTAYNELKNVVIGEEFPWFWVADAVRGQYSTGQTNVNNFPFFSHVFLDRPGDNKSYPVVVSNIMDLVEAVFFEKCREKNISPKVLYRANANMTLPSISGNTEVIAKLDEEIVGVKSNNIVGLTFHPELTNDNNYLNWLDDFILKGSHVRTL